MKAIVLTAIIFFTCTTVFALPSSLTMCWSEKRVENSAVNHSSDGIIDPAFDATLGNNTGAGPGGGDSDYDKNNPSLCGGHPGHNHHHNHYGDRPYCGDGDDGPNDNVIPEPTTILLLGLGGLGFGIYRKFRK